MEAGIVVSYAQTTVQQTKLHPSISYSLHRPCVSYTFGSEPLVKLGQLKAVSLEGNHPATMGSHFGQQIPLGPL